MQRSFANKIEDSKEAQEIIHSNTLKFGYKGFSINNAQLESKVINHKLASGYKKEAIHCLFTRLLGVLMRCFSSLLISIQLFVYV